MTTVAELRVQEHTEWAYVLFVEGIGTAWTTDESGALEGTGASSWIGVSEQDLIDEADLTEVVGQRTVTRGLVVPTALRFGRDDTDGQLEGSTVTFKLLDTDGTLATLFASSGKTFDLLSQVIGSTTSALGTSVNINQNTSTTNPRGKWVDVERIGPSGQRGFFPCFPGFGMPGYEHLASTVQPESGGPPPVKISSSPIVFTGRRVALYRLVRDTHSTSLVPRETWPEWRLQHAGGSLLWWGTMQDAGHYEGADMWSVRCWGPESLLRRAVGVRTSITEWTTVSPSFAHNTTAGERTDQVAVWFTANGTRVDNTSFVAFHDGTLFASTLTGTTSTAAQAELETLITNIKGGTGANYSGADGYLTEGASGYANYDNADKDAQLTNGRAFVVQSEQVNVAMSMHVVLHERVWALLGYDIHAQRSEGGDGEEQDSYTIDFTMLDSGETILDAANVPGPGYWRGTFATYAPGVNAVTAIGPSDRTNSGQPRNYKPLWPNGLMTLTLEGGQDVGLNNVAEAACQGNLLCAHDGATVGGSAVNRAGLWAFRGKIHFAEEEDDVETVQVALCEWRNDSWASSTVDDGKIDTLVDIYPGFRIRRWLEPQLFGFNTRRLDRDWPISTFTDGNPVQCRPLSALPAANGDKLDYAYQCLTAVLCSTGSGSGYSGAVQNNPTFGVGSNALSGSIAGSDSLAASYGLGIPAELLDTQLGYRSQFPGGYGAPLNRIRLAWFGEVRADELLQSICQPRRLGWTLDGRRYKLQRIEDVTATTTTTITESDLCGTPGQPDSVIPSQEWRALVPIDEIEFAWRQDPEEHRPQLRTSFRARDQGARARGGHVRLTVSDWGLPPTDVWASASVLQGITGTPSWRVDAEALWAVEAAGFAARRHFTVEDLYVDAKGGQDLYPGSLIRLTNQWVMGPNGVRGVTAHLGVILECAHELKTRRVKVRAMLFEDGAPSGTDGLPYFAPLWKLAAYDPATKTCYLESDHLGHGDAAVLAGTGIAEPSWSTAGGTTYLQFWSWSGGTTSRDELAWRSGPVVQVASVDTAAGTVVLAATPSSTIYRDVEWWIGPPSYDHANTAAWQKAVYGIIVRSNLTGGTVPTLGRKFADAP